MKSEKYKIVYIAIAAILVVSLAVIMVFTLNRGKAIRDKETTGVSGVSEPVGDDSDAVGTKDAETDAATGETGAAEEQSATPEEDAIVVPSGIDPEDPYGGVVLPSATDVISEPDPPSDHSHKWVVSKEGPRDDPEKPSVDEYKCSVCGEMKRVYVPAKEHEWVDSVVAPTCSERGYTTHKCSLCGLTYADTFVDASGHDFGEWTKNGADETRTCSRCGKVETRSSGGEVAARSMTVGSAEAAPGETVSVPVALVGNPGICAFTLAFEYDTNVLTLDSAAPSPSLGGQFNFGTKAAWISFSDYEKDGEILTLYFTVNAGASSGAASPVSVVYGSGDICNFNEDDVDFAVVPGTVTVK